MGDQMHVAIAAGRLTLAAPSTTRQSSMGLAQKDCSQPDAVMRQPPAIHGRGVRVVRCRFSPVAGRGAIPPTRLPPPTTSTASAWKTASSGVHPWLERRFAGLAQSGQHVAESIGRPTWQAWESVRACAPPGRGDSDVLVADSAPAGRRLVGCRAAFRQVLTCSLSKSPSETAPDRTIMGYLRRKGPGHCRKLPQVGTGIWFALLGVVTGCSRRDLP